MFVLHASEGIILEIAWYIVAGIVAAMTVFSGLGKLKGVPQVSATMQSVGVGEGLTKALGVLSLVLGLALALTLAFAPVFAVLPAAALASYYFGAIVAHWRVKDWFPVPPIVLFLLATASTVFSPPVQGLFDQGY